MIYEVGYTTQHSGDEIGEVKYYLLQDVWSCVYLLSKIFLHVPKLVLYCVECLGNRTKKQVVLLVKFNLSHNDPLDKNLMEDFEEHDIGKVCHAPGTILIHLLDNRFIISFLVVMTNVAIDELEHAKCV